MKKLIVFISIIFFFSCDLIQINKDRKFEEPTTLICKNIDKQMDNITETLLVHKDTIRIPSDYSSGFYLIEGNKTNINHYCFRKGFWKRNWCQNFGYITYFNGKTLILSKNEYECRIP